VEVEHLETSPEHPNHYTYANGCIYRQCEIVICVALASDVVAAHNRLKALHGVGNYRLDVMKPQQEKR
jgi:hypothetical protein